MLRPYKFKPYFRTVLWGGNKIARFKGIAASLKHVGESWELSSVPGRESIVIGGDDDGLTLTALIARHGAALMGEDALRRYGNEFPLLVKFIDAHQNLSVQVHPDDKLARERHGCCGKTEMWYVVKTERDARIWAGLSQQITPDEYDRHVAEGTILDVVAQHRSHPGDVFFLPAGRIHTIGAGNLLVEIQQTSDITYRISDFNRLDAQGNHRQLHTALARKAIDYRVYDDYVKNCNDDTEGINELVSCDHFVVSRLVVHGECGIDVPQSFLIVVCIDGAAAITDDGGSVTAINRGETILVPACLNRLTIRGDATLLTARLP